MTDPQLGPSIPASQRTDHETGEISKDCWIWGLLFHAIRASGATFWMQTAAEVCERCTLARSSVTHRFLQWAFEYTNAGGAFVPPTHLHCPESSHILLPKAARPLFVTDRVTSPKKTKHVIAHKVPPC